MLTNLQTSPYSTYAQVVSRQSIPCLLKLRWSSKPISSSSRTPTARTLALTAHKARKQYTTRHGYPHRRDSCAFPARVAQVLRSSTSFFLVNNVTRAIRPLFASPPAPGIYLISASSVHRPARGFLDIDSFYASSRRLSVSLNTVTARS